MRDLKPPHDPIEALGQAYERLFEAVAEEWKKAGEKTEPVLRELITEAREKLLAAGEITEEQGRRLAEYLERDLHELGRYLADTGRELRDWLGFETALLEDWFLGLLLDAADRTEVEWLRMRLENARRAEYRTGEVAMPGTFECVDCGETLRLHRAGHLPPCPRCQGTRFRRRVRD